MKIVIVDNMDKNSENLKEQLLNKIEEVVEIIIIDNETEALNLVRLDYDLFIINTMIEGIDNEFIKYCSRKGKKVIVYTDDLAEEKVEIASSLKLIDYVIKSKNNTSEIIIEILKRYLKNSELKIVFFSNDEKTKFEIISHIESQNINLIEARTINDISKLILDNNVEMLLIDYEMLNDKELEIVRLIREEYNMNELPIILFTYFFRNYIVAKFLRAGVNDIIYKPYLKEELINIINLTIDRKELYKENYEWFLMDSITGLYKFKAIENFAQKMLSNTIREKNPFSLIIAKVIFQSEEKSKSKRNQILKHFGNILGSSLRKGDLVSKFSDDKILILLPNTPKSGAKTVIDKLKLHIKSYPCLDENENIIPYGIEAVSEESNQIDLNTMIDIADDLLYRAVKFGS